MKKPYIDDYRFDDDFPHQYIKDMEIWEEEKRDDLIDEVIESLREQFILGDYTVLEEILRFVPIKNLINSLPEETWIKYS